MFATTKGSLFHDKVYTIPNQDVYKSLLRVKQHQTSGNNIFKKRKKI